MTDITKSKYFFYGSANYNKKTDEYVQYGLYDPITDRFVLISQFCDALHKIAMLFSSRLSLRLCRLTTASNFSANLIDNTCCFNWTIKNRDNLTISRKIGEHITSKLYNVLEFSTAETLSTKELIVDNREYLLAAYDWVTDNEKKSWLLYKTDPFYFSELELSAVITLPLELSSTAKDINDVYDIIYSEFDFNIAREKIETILMKYT